jgi:hypothetical protein
MIWMSRCPIIRAEVEIRLRYGLEVFRRFFRSYRRTVSKGEVSLGQGVVL